MRAKISCNDSGWGFELLRTLQEGYEVDLTHFDLVAHGQFCQLTGQRFNMLTVYDDPSKTLLFVKPDVTAPQNPGV
jgi:hypothetical protein